MKLKFFKHTWIFFILIIGIYLLFIWEKSKLPQAITLLDLTKTDNPFYLDETQYEKEMSEIVVPYLDHSRKTGYFTTSDGAQLYYEQYLNEDTTNHIVISHGFTESSQKYKEVIYYFLKGGYSVSILDYRGHGYSQRFTEDPSKVHITTYDTYVDDLHTFMQTIVYPSCSKNYFLYAHSMGGAIGTLYIEKYPDAFQGAVLSAPMMSIHTGKTPTSVSRLLAQVINLIGLKENYIPGQGPYDPTLDFEGSCATSMPRYLYQSKLKIDDKSLQLNGGSIAWLKASFNATDKLIKDSELANLPILIFQAENDTLVKPEGHSRFISNAPQASLIFVKDAKHELYNTPNTLLIPYFNTIFDFYQQTIS